MFAGVDMFMKAAGKDCTALFSLLLLLLFCNVTELSWCFVACCRLALEHHYFHASWCGTKLHSTLIK